MLRFRGRGSGRNEMGRKNIKIMGPRLMREGRRVFLKQVENKHNSQSDRPKQTAIWGRYFVDTS